MVFPPCLQSRTSRRGEQPPLGAWLDGSIANAGNLAERWSVRGYVPTLEHGNNGESWGIRTKQSPQTTWSASVFCLCLLTPEFRRLSSAPPTFFIDKEQPPLIG